MSLHFRSQPKPRHGRQGFTLIEILVVVIIIAILLAMLLPAVNAARDAARSSLSQNNLRQIGVAGAHYESKNRHFPPSWRGDASMADTTGSVAGWSIHALLLPYLEQRVLESEIDYSLPYTEVGNVTTADGVTQQLSAMRVPTYLSPAERRDEARISGGAPKHYPLNYGVNLGTWLVFDPDTETGGSGVAYPNSKVTSAHCFDGHSQTLFFAEVKGWQPYYRNAAKTGAALSGFDPVTKHVVNTTTGLSSFCTDTDLAGGDFKDSSGHTEWVDGRAHQIGFTTAFTPNTKIKCEEGGQVYDVDWTNWQEGKNRYATTPDLTPTYSAVTARSYFEGGVNVVMLDGSVKWVDNDINPGVWRAYGTRDGSDIIPAKEQL